MIEAILSVAIAVPVGVFVMYLGWPDVMHRLFRRQRQVPHADSKADFISEIWAEDTIKTLGFIEALMILISPNYPHTWRRFSGWWHRHFCYPCAEARVRWPLAKAKFLDALAPFKRDLPELPKDDARAWVEEEIRHHSAVTFKPLIVEAVQKGVDEAIRYQATIPQGHGIESFGFYRTPREAAMQFKPIEERERLAASTNTCVAWPHHFCRRSFKMCAAGHNGVRCCRCKVIYCRWVVDHTVPDEEFPSEHDDKGAR